MARIRRPPSLGRRRLRELQPDRRCARRAKRARLVAARAREGDVSRVRAAHHRRIDPRSQQRSARVPSRGRGAILFDLLPDRFSFTTTITVAAIADGLAVRFTAIEYLPRIGRSKVRPIPDTLRIGRQVLRLGIRFAPLRTAAWVAGTCALMFALSSAWHAATSG